MKQLLIILSFVSLQCFAQEKTSRGKDKSVEVGMSAGISQDNSAPRIGFANPYGAMSLLKNLGAFQAGVSIEAGRLYNYYSYASPSAVFNYKFHTNESYVYLGCSAGYFHTWNNWKFTPTAVERIDGYVAGLQAGYVWQPGKHLGLITDISLKYAKTYWPQYSWWGDDGRTGIEKAHNKSDLILSFSFGIRYKF